MSSTLLGRKPANIESEDESWEFVVPDVNLPTDEEDSEQKPALSFSLNAGRFARLSFELRSAASSPAVINPTQSVISPNDPPRRASHDQSQSLLLSLPWEIRLQIYETHFRFPIGDRGVPMIWRPSTSSMGAIPSVLTILATCRQVRDEAETLFFSLNRLSVPHHSHPTAFWQSVAPRRRKAITKYTIGVVSGAQLYTMLQAVRNGSNLRSLYIQRQGSLRYCNIAEWRVMSAQIVNELRKLENLEEIVVFTPGFNEPDATTAERRRQQELEDVDRKLCAVVKE